MVLTRNFLSVSSDLCVWGDVVGGNVWWAVVCGCGGGYAWEGLVLQLHTMFNIIHTYSTITPLYYDYTMTIL